MKNTYRINILKKNNLNGLPLDYDNFVSRLTEVFQFC